MIIPDYTLVCAVDHKHLRQLQLTWPTWYKYKPSLLSHPMLVIYDKDQVIADEIQQVVNHPDLHVLAWPPTKVIYNGIPEDRWCDPQRYKMLASFVYAANFVETTYFLKLDVDTVATGCDDWIDPEWFRCGPAIVSQPWSFTKPADQMMKLDEWVVDNMSSVPELYVRPDLNLIPKPGWSRVRHKRIISWCGFFETEFTRRCSEWASETCGRYKLPVPSQDGYMFYVAKRLGREIVRAGMKKRGWEHWTTMRNIREAVGRSLANG